jgi:hypothetical protein
LDIKWLLTDIIIYVKNESSYQFNKFQDFEYWSKNGKKRNQIRKNMTPWKRFVKPRDYKSFEKFTSVKRAIHFWGVWTSASQ